MHWTSSDGLFNFVKYIWWLSVAVELTVIFCFCVWCWLLLICHYCIIISVPNGRIIHNLMTNSTFIFSQISIFDCLMNLRCSIISQMLLSLWLIWIMILKSRDSALLFIVFHLFLIFEIFEFLNKNCAKIYLFLLIIIKLNHL